MTWMQPISFRFLAPQIADAICGKYFHGKRKLGMLDPEFINRVNGTMVGLTCAILCLKTTCILTWGVSGSSGLQA